MCQSRHAVSKALTGGDRDRGAARGPGRRQAGGVRQGRPRLLRGVVASSAAASRPCRPSPRLPVLAVGELDPATTIGGLLALLSALTDLAKFAGDLAATRRMSTTARPRRPPTSQGRASRNDDLRLVALGLQP